MTVSAFSESFGLLGISATANLLRLLVELRLTYREKGPLPIVDLFILNHAA
jgi:hypothetical protein